MDSTFCSILAAKEGEPIDGTAPEKDSAIFIPADKFMWHRISIKEQLIGLPKNSDLSQAIASFERPLVIFYVPNESTGNHILVSTSKGINCFTISGSRTKKIIHRLYAICTDGVKDACCAKFGIPIAKAFSEACEKAQLSQSIEVSHIGGCRFAATAVCFPSGNSYGRMTTEDTLDIMRAEEEGLIISKIFRGNIYVSEIHCWIMRHSMEHFGYVPTPAETEILKLEDRFNITITPSQQSEFKFDLYLNEVEFQLFSGCSNISSGRSITRSVYDFA